MLLKKTNTKILHVSDIHIRLFKRHDEYQQVFEKLYQTFKDYLVSHPNDNVLIAVTGDIVHAKTDMSPEMVSLVSELFKNLADIAPTIVVPGNHDMNLANPNRMDALSPIVDNLNHPNLSYWKKSGIYGVGDVDFYVYSIMDSQVDWPSVIANNDKKVGIYHGPINGAKTDTGHVMTGKYVELEQFDGLDIVLLGDIHRFQVMKDKDPVVLYPGSLIQQNHGETLGMHGWVEWDLETKTYIHHEADNDYGYATVTLTDKNINIPKLPKNVRLRIMTENVDASIVKKFLSVLKMEQNVNILEVAVNKGKSIEIDSTDAQQDVLNVNDVTCQNKLIREYIEQNYPQTASEVIDKTLEINTRLNSSLKEDELPRNIAWKPIKLKFDNLFSYGEGNEINFENMTGLYGIFSANATGKTSAFDALCFALYDKTPRAYKGAHIMNTRADKCSCEFIFDVGPTRYRIVRTGNRKKGGDVKVDVEFTKYENGVWTALHGADRRDTNSIIRSYIGNYDDFVLTNLSVQNQNSLFIDKGQSERKDLLSQFMGLTIFDRLHDIAAEESKEISGALKRFNKEDFTTALINTQADIDKLNPEYDKYNAELERWKLEVEQFNEKIVQKNAEKLPVVAAIKDKATIEKQKAETQKKAKQLQTIDIPAFKEELTLAQKAAIEAQKNEEKLSVFHIKTKQQIITDAMKQLTEMEETRLDINGKMDKLRGYREIWLEKIEALKTHEYDPNCKYCINNQFVKDAQKAIESYAKSEPMIKKLIGELNSLTDTMFHWVPAREQLAEYNKAVTARLNAVSVALRKEMNVKDASTSLSSILQLITQYDAAIALYEQNEAAILHNIKIEEEVRELRLEREDADLTRNQFETATKTTFGKLKVAISRKEDILARVKEAEELEDTYEAYENYIFAVCRDGIPYQLIAKIIPAIQAEVNNVLSQIVDFTVILEVDGKNVNGRIVYDTDRTWPLELASGMEKFISGLAIRVALMSVSNLPRSNFLVIDEGLGVLDKDNLSSMSALFDMLKTEFDFLVLISHLEVVRDIADYLIDIKRVDGYSYISV